MLGVRTAGTGTDSAGVPLVAVGNVPCDGTNPPKYLDAEFNFLQVLDADGVWREAEDGAEIAVTAGRSVRARASAGNMQEAAWLPGGGTGSVVLAGRGPSGLVRALFTLVKSSTHKADKSVLPTDDQYTAAGADALDELLAETINGF